MIELTGLTKRYGALTAVAGVTLRVEPGEVYALLGDSPVLVLDEPTHGLDVLSGQAIYDLIVRERGRGKTILFSTHQMEEVELLADRVGVPAASGQLVAEGPPEELVARTGAPNLVRAFLALVGGDVVVGPATEGAADA